MALTLFKPFVIGKLIEDGVVYNVKHAEKIIEESGKIVWDALDEVIEGKYVLLRLKSGETRKVMGVCRATIGTVGNLDYELVHLGKAGRKRHMGIRPTVRGSVMNPNDHPHGGGEGKTGIGRVSPVTPWGKPALGYKTRKKNKPSNQYIVKKKKKK